MIRTFPHYEIQSAGQMGELMADLADDRKSCLIVYSGPIGTGKTALVREALQIPEVESLGLRKIDEPDLVTKRSRTRYFMMSDPDTDAPAVQELVRDRETNIVVLDNFIWSPITSPMSDAILEVGAQIFAAKAIGISRYPQPLIGPVARNAYTVFMHHARFPEMHEYFARMPFMFAAVIGELKKWSGAEKSHVRFNMVDAMRLMDAYYQSLDIEQFALDEDHWTNLGKMADAHSILKRMGFIVPTTYPYIVKEERLEQVLHPYIRTVLDLCSGEFQRSLSNMEA